MGDVDTFPLGKPTKNLYGTQGIWTSETSDDIILKVISHQRIISKLLGAPLKLGVWSNLSPAPCQWDSLVVIKEYPL